MKFKKDYINYLLYRTVYGSNGDFKDDPLIKKIADKIISVDDTGKATFLVGKTEGLESLFKYLLYISDKIDKSQISIFNLKDNIDYDAVNLRKICKGIKDYKSGKTTEEIEDIPAEQLEEKHTIKIDLSEDESTPADVESEEKEPDLTVEEHIEEETGMTLIENPDDKGGEVEVFELDSISKSLETTDLIEDTEPLEKPAEIKHEPGEEEIPVEETEAGDESIELQKQQVPASQLEAETFDEETDTGQIEITERKTTIESDEEIIEEEIPEQIIEEAQLEKTAEITEPEPELEIEVRKPAVSDQFIDKDQHVKEESVPNEAYNKFETKFFEEVKILEKLLATVDRELRNKKDEKLSEKSLQSLTEIIEITSELSNLSRQLMFDLIADVFFTMNLYFTKVISSPVIFESEKNMLFDSSLALVNSLIKGEDYLNYDLIIEKIEKLKNELTGPEEEKFEDKEPEQEKPKEEISVEELKSVRQKVPESIITVPEIAKPEGPAVDSAVFKLKYLVKEFEKSFTAISTFKGEYGRFEALDKINELNNALRLIAKISTSINEYDVLKLAEVSYVFLKYLKDYRIDLLDAEIQQIIKYMIFTFKMLLTNRKPDDFDILVQHLNNPVKIFTDN